ncbi:MAG: putative sugar O-methyltransferase [Actinomycetota bacterium]|nr:putative sugar O-methyltransferase [Actinomycetota bacterium]
MKNVSIDKETFQEIVSDMAENAGSLLPTLNWITLDPMAPTDVDSKEHLSATFSDEGFHTKFSSMDKLLDAWVGGTQMQRLEKEHRRRYETLLPHYDPLGLWAANVGDPAVAQTLLNGDLGSIMDLNFLYCFAPPRRHHPTAILEIGGGYGRLAEAALNVFGKSIRYVLVDSVPGSLCYSNEYLSRACPDARIGYYYSGDDFDLARYDCYIMPSWHFERLNSYFYDMCVNIESFQEMSQVHVDYYLQLFEKVSHPEALLFVSNSHDYVFKGEWRYPKNWRKILCVATPRSWTNDHRTEIFIKSEGDFSHGNRMVDEFYRLAGVPRNLRSSLRATRTLLMQRIEWEIKRRLRGRRKETEGFGM